MELNHKMRLNKKSVPEICANLRNQRCTGGAGAFLPQISLIHTDYIHKLKGCD